MEPFSNELLTSVNAGTCRSICQRATTMRENSASSVTINTLCWSVALSSSASFLFGFTVSLNLQLLQFFRFFHQSHQTLCRRRQIAGGINVIHRLAHPNLCLFFLSFPLPLP